jgi:acetyl-CoA carboxylase carboxyl transferase subunit alpha
MGIQLNSESNLAVTEPAFNSVKTARHPERPYALDYIGKLFEDFTELHGDRRFADDPAIICGFASYHNSKVLIIGQQKGRDTKQRRFRNFGMSKPEGYRKAIRAMECAEKFGRPIISLIDTPGAYPGIDAEERGQAEAIANSLFVMSTLTVPILNIIIGEGGSGGALAIGVGDAVIILENSIYSVITPEGCAAILWKNSSEAPLASKFLRLTARDLLQLRIVDKIVPEPGAGAHTSLEETCGLLDVVLKRTLDEVIHLTPQARWERRYTKLRAMGYA